MLICDDTGDGMPVVLVHGHPFDRTMWRPQVAAFRDAYRIIVPDLRGYGASTGLPTVTAFDEFAGDLAELLDRLGVARVALAGLSMGGQIVLDFYRQFPERVSALVLADTFAQLDTEDGRAARLSAAARLEREGMAAYAAEALPRMVAARTLREQPEVAAHVLEMMQRADPAGAAAALRARAARRDYLPRLPHVRVPTLVVVGRDDAFTPVADAERMQRAIPAARLAVIDDAGHMPNLERPGAFNAVLAAFLGELRAPPAGRTGAAIAH